MAGIDNDMIAVMHPLDVGSTGLPPGQSSGSRAFKAVPPAQSLRVLAEVPNGVSVRPIHQSMPPPRNPAAETYRLPALGHLSRVVLIDIPPGSPGSM